MAGLPVRGRRRAAAEAGVGCRRRRGGPAEGVSVRRGRRSTRAATEAPALRRGSAPTGRRRASPAPLRRRAAATVLIPAVVATVVVMAIDEHGRGSAHDGAAPDADA